MGRTFLFILTNLAIMATLMISYYSLIYFGVIPTKYTNHYTGLAIFALIFGFSGSFISLWLSKWMAKRVYGLHTIDPNNPDNDFQDWYCKTVIEMSNELNIKTPEITLYMDDSPNAFATGASKNSSLIALSSGLIENMEPHEVKAVIGHEMAHIA